MSYVQLSEGGFQVFISLACGLGFPEVSKSYSDVASKLFTFTFTLGIACHTVSQHWLRKHLPTAGICIPSETTHR